MKYRTKRTAIPSIALWVAFFLCGVFFFALPIGAVPQAPGVPDSTHAQAVIVYNEEADAILFEQNADKVLFPASTVKIMTGLLASELLSDRMEETVTVTAEMVDGVVGNRMKLAEGEKIRIRDLFFGAITGGYNDACTALAVLSCGSVEAFVSAMNARAEDLGMQSTVYCNPTGLHDPAMVTTARDTLILSRVTSKNARYMEASSAVKHTVSATNLSAERIFYNRNYQIASAVTTAYHNPYVDGLNAGTTTEGGWCLAARALRFDLTWFCVVLGGEEDADTVYSYKIANELLSWAARGYEFRTVVTAGSTHATVPVSYAAIAEDHADGVDLIAKNGLSLFLPINAEADTAGLGYTVLMHSDTLTAPFDEGTEVGTLVVTWNGEEIGRVPLVTAAAVARNEFTYALGQLKDLPKHRAFIAGAVAFVLLLALYLFRVTRFRPRKLRKKNYVPMPFRVTNEDTLRYDLPPRPPVPPQPTRAERPPERPSGKRPPSDPYSDAAKELSRRKKKP